jgi:hypothetical protein
MDRPGALASLNGKILASYSVRTITALRNALAFRVALAHLQPVLALNLDKEIRKDTLVIRHAGYAVAAGQAPAKPDAQKLYVETQAIDATFLQDMESSPVRVVIPYDEIEPLRVRRIQYVIEAAYRILSVWPEHRGLKAALRAIYGETDFELLICMILDLYARETRALARAVRVPAALAPLQDRFARHVGSVMSEVGMRLAQDLARRIYRI